VQSSPYRTHDLLFHRASIDRIDEILNKGRLTLSKGRKGISFTEGIPKIPGHSDSAIVFRREWLEKKKCETHKIDYDNSQMVREFAVIGDPARARNDEIEKLRWIEKELEVLGNLDLESKIFIEGQINAILAASDDEINQNLINQFSVWENEIIAIEQQLTFEMTDVVAVIPFHRFYDDHFSSLASYKDRIIFVDDLIRYGPDAIADELLVRKHQIVSIINSEIVLLGKNVGEPSEDTSVRLSDQDALKLISNYPRMTFNFVAFHVACSMIDNRKNYQTVSQLFPNYKFPVPVKKLTDLLDSLHLLPNNQFKSDFLNHFSSRLSMDETRCSLLDDLYSSEVYNRISEIQSKTE